MAAQPDAVYFPTLDQCLKGDKVLLSWKLVAPALQDSYNDRLLSDAVSDFLRDAHVHGLIQDPAKAFGKPNPQTKSEFETRTAAINVTPTQSDKYDVKIIKEDALWLSQNVNINEVAALRIVTIEFQNRPQAHLSGPLSTQDAINLRQAVGADGTQANTLLASVNVADTVDVEMIWSSFDAEASRRRRLLETYLSERRYFMMFVDNVLGLMLENASTRSAGQRTALCQQLLQATFGDQDLAEARHAKREALLTTYLELLSQCIPRGENGPEVLATMDFELDWERTVVTETLHFLSSIFQIIDLVETFLPTDIVSTWFEFVDTYFFLDQMQSMDEQTVELLQPAKSLACVISMKLLNVPRMVPFLQGDSDLTLHPDEDSYVTSEEVLGQIDATISNAYSASLLTAGPVIFSWTLIVREMLISHHERQERRDLQQNRQAQEGFEREIQHVEVRPGGGRRSSAGSIVSMESQSYDKFLTTVFGHSQLQQDMQRPEEMAIGVTAGGQMHNYLTEMALSLGESHNAPFRPLLGAKLRLVLLDFLDFSFPTVGYISESLSTFFAVLSAGRGYWDFFGEETADARQDLVIKALGDSLTNSYYIQQVWLRWPYEFKPFTRLCKAMSASYSKQAAAELHRILANTPALTFHLPDFFWEFSEDEADMGRLEVVNEVPLFSVLPSRKRLVAGAEPFCIPAGSQGQLASDSSRIVQIQYPHSTLALLGKRLETNLAADSYALTLGSLEEDDLAEAISFIATLIRCEDVKAAASKNAAALEVLQQASRELPHYKDIVTVITDTLDAYIDGDLANLDSSGIRVITSCLQFLDSILPICPGRVWSYMTRCDLLMSASKAGRLSRMTSTLGLGEEQFDLLVTVVKFFSSLVESSVAGAVHRKISTKTNGRAAENDLIWQGTSDKALEQVNLSIAHTSVDILENSLTWRFPSEVHRSMLLRDLIPILTRIIVYPFGMRPEGDAEDEGFANNANGVEMVKKAKQNSRPLTPFLEPAARYIIDGFLSTTPSSLRFQPILASMLVALALPDSTLYQRRAEIVSGRQIAVLEFATTLIRVANFKAMPATAIEGQLLKCSSLLARLCATDPLYRDSTLSLLGALATRISREDSEAPSLLGYLGPQISRSFLQAISKLDKPFDRPGKSQHAWTFFSTIMRTGQHWMANCLLTGKTPREALGGNGYMSKLAPDSILKTAVTRLRSISTMPTSETLAVLDLLTSAHNYWQWTVFASQEDNSCLSELRAYVRGLKPISTTMKADASRACDEARIAAYIAEAFAMHLYHLRKTGREKDFARELANDIDYYLRDGVTVSGYNSSLHANFAKNLSRQYPGFSLEGFKRTLLLPWELGKQYYYALDVADKMLRFDPGWTGPRERNGFRDEMEAANLNLSLVDAQVALFHAWEFLLLELSNCLSANEHLITTQMIQVAKQCLDCNQTNQGPERIFLRITQSRANLALVIMQRLPTTSLASRDVADLVITAWSTVSSIGNPLVPEQIQHWRTMLRMLYVALRTYGKSSTRSSSDNSSRRADDTRIVEVTQCVFNILHRVVAQGFRSLAALVHDSQYAVLPEDMALVTAILQACLCLPAIDEYSGEILNIMISEDVGRAALSLYSWADRLAINGDPIYGELSMLFLLQLSNVPAMAEHLASDGLLAQIAASNITAHIQKPNVAPFADNVGAQRCYDIWAKGILPLLLNVLSAPGLGPNIATEVAYVLNQFPHLLESSAMRIEAPGMSRTAARGVHFITLLGVSEINSLALLTRVLTGYRTNFNREIPEVPWDTGAVLESVDYWLTTRVMLRERLVSLGQREADWKNMKTGVDGVSVLEEKAISLLEAVKEVLSEELE